LDKEQEYLTRRRKTYKEQKNPFTLTRECSGEEGFRGDQGRQGTRNGLCLLSRKIPYKPLREKGVRQGKIAETGLGKEA